MTVSAAVPAVLWMVHGLPSSKLRRHVRRRTPRTPEPKLSMSHLLIVDLARNALMVALMLAGPLLAIALGVGLLISVVQAVTSIQEQTLSFVPKLFAVAAAFLFALPWMLQVMVKYTTELFRSLPTLIS
jgi:flagellar biosynthetic protein FliQ